MKEIIHTNSELCVGCNRCVRECPMELANITYQDEDNNIKVKTDHSKCIGCGRCVTACRHQARIFEDDTDRFFSDLLNGADISLIAAPSVRTNIPDYKRLFTWLKNMGVNKIYDVSLGADICIWAHIRYIGKNGLTPMITQPCPAIVSYCEVYRHDLLKRLSPVHSPMACTAVYMREYEGIHGKIAALSPCIAKSNEFEDTQLVQYNVTFARLRGYLDKYQIELPAEETGFDHYDSGLGVLFPMPGGLKENIEFYLGKKVHVSTAEGFDVYEKLNIYTITDEGILPDIFDVLNCSDGCNMGTACMHESSIFDINHKIKKGRKEATDNRNEEYFGSLFKSYDSRFDLSCFMRKYRPVHSVLPRITEEDIEQAFQSLGKKSFERQHVDCGACGSATCHHMARKIALNVNIPINCMVNAMETAREEHAQKIMSDRESRAKSEFLSSMSHEMRTPMNAIIGMTQIAAKTGEVEKLKYCLSSIENSSKHLLGLINDILDMAKIESGKLELVNSPMNIEKMLERVCNLIIEKIEIKNIKFNVTFDTHMRMAYNGDDMRLAQVVTNLLSNAVKFTPENGRIDLAACEVQKEDGYSVIRFSVRDTGIGMTDEQTGRMFNAFEQADSSTTRKYGGTGLGLAISKRIIDMMGGKIWVKSQPGKGSDFSFEVRLEHYQQGMPEISGNNAAGDVSVLIVDANGEESDYFREITGSIGINADAAGNGEEALTLINRRNAPYDIVFIDCGSPEIDGVEIAKSVNKIIDKDTAVIIITSFLRWSSIDSEVRDVGVYGFISRPLFPSAVVNMINGVTGSAEGNYTVMAPAEAEIPDLSHVSLLLAEDVELNREIFISLLEETKVHIDVAENGRIAVEKFAENPGRYDLIIMDIQMPEMDGLEATRTIRSLENNRAKTIPIVAMTANAFREDIEKCIKSGMNDHLTKLIEMGAVIKMIMFYCVNKR